MKYTVKNYSDRILFARLCAYQAKIRCTWSGSWVLYMYLYVMCESLSLMSKIDNKWIVFSQIVFQFQKENDLVEIRILKKFFICIYILILSLALSKVFRKFKIEPPVHYDAYFGMDGLCHAKCR
jgi:hypothetical protein